MTPFATFRNLLSSAVITLTVLTACSPQPSAPTPPVAVAPVQAKPQPTPERLIERSRSRWTDIASKDWIAAYDYLTPEQKQNLALTQFLQGKENHEYANPNVKDVLQIDGEQGFVRATVLWTPRHPQLANVQIPEGESLTDELQMIETWRWIDGDWLYVTAERDSEFLEKHPELLKVTQSTATAEPEPSTPK